MASRGPSYEKRERDRAKKARAAAKRDKRLEKGEDVEPGEGEDEVEATPAAVLDESEVLKRLEELHQKYDAEQISFDDFEERRAELLSHLSTS